MTQYLTKSTNQTALELSNYYPTFEQCLTAVSNIKYQKDLRIKSDPISSQHILVESYSRGTLQDKFKIEKNAIEHANKNRLALYHLVAVTLDHFKAA